MTDHTPPTEQQLDEIEARAAGLYEYAAGLDDAWQAEADQLAGTDVPGLVETVRHLRTELAKEQRLHGDTIDDRDHFHEMADKLAYAVAPIEVIGEHSSMNCPWVNALDLITPSAEVDRLRQRITELETYAHGCDAEGHVLPHSSWCEPAKKTAADNDGCTCGRPWADHPQPHAMHCWTVNPPRAEVEEMRRALAAAQRDRDLAIAHDRQPYPTAWAYEQACKAREAHRERADAAEAKLGGMRADIFREVADICDEAGAAYTAKALNDHAGAAFDLMERFQRKADEVEYVATPCDSTVPCEGGGEPCHVHERLMAHADGDHDLCEPDCGVRPAMSPTAVDGRPEPRIPDHVVNEEQGPDDEATAAVVVPAVVETGEAGA